MARKTLKDFMPADVRKSLGDLPTTHANCMEASKSLGTPGGVARPGKTARDRARRERVA